MLAAALLLVLGWLRTGPDLEQLLPAKDPREQVCAYMEEDFGIPFQSIYNKTKLERHDNVFAPEDSVGDMFLAGPDGERDVEAGRRGYTTNYPDMMVLWALEDFAQEQGLDELDLMNRNQNLESWNTAGGVSDCPALLRGGGHHHGPGRSAGEAGRRGLVPAPTPLTSRWSCAANRWRKDG